MAFVPACRTFLETIAAIAAGARIRARKRLPRSQPDKVWTPCTAGLALKARNRSGGSRWDFRVTFDCRAESSSSKPNPICVHAKYTDWCRHGAWARYTSPGHPTRAAMKTAPRKGPAGTANPQESSRKPRRFGLKDQLSVTIGARLIGRPALGGPELPPVKCRPSILGARAWPG